MTSRKNKRLTIEDRVKIIERLERGEIAVTLADEYGVTSSAISQLKKKKENILMQKQTLEECGSSTKRKRYTGIESTPREQALFQWVSQKRDIGDVVTGPIVTEQALMFNQALQGSSDFKASAGFLHSFKKRHSLRALSVQGEKLSADNVASEEFAKAFPEFCRVNGYGLDRVYNADETGLYWKMMPNRTLVKPTERQAPGRKVLKDRVTLMVCTNASGTHKIPLLVIGKSQKPRCFKNVKKLPVEYRGQKSAWITRDLTLDWYENIFLPAVIEKHGAEHKFLLLLDNAPSHPSIKKFEKISDLCRVMYLPPNVTSLIQPMDQGIIEQLKKVYKRNLLRLILTPDTAEGVTQLLKKINMLDVLNFVAFLWDQVIEGTIRKCWKKLFPLEVTNPESANVDQLSGRHILNLVRALPNCSEATDQDAEEWLNTDAHDPGWKLLSPEEIMDGEAHDSEGEEEEENEETSVDAEDTVFSEREALKSVQYLMGWYQRTWECTPASMRVLENIREYLEMFYLPTTFKALHFSTSIFYYLYIYIFDCSRVPDFMTNIKKLLNEIVNFFHLKVAQHLHKI